MTNLKSVTVLNNTAGNQKPFLIRETAFVFLGIVYGSKKCASMKEKHSSMQVNFRYLLCMDNIDNMIAKSYNMVIIYEWSERVIIRVY
ncbi:MAG: hypothetical protein BWY11_01438 [Firmicutes bacterium ADurb.Bin182]|nr:MAG: hypothetical protein BWY11_01438 [Firmicutes bacterium ADurb.Bin182]